MRKKGLERTLPFLAMAALVVAGSGHAESVNLTRHGESIDVVIGGKPFTTYHFDPQISKAFLEPLRDATGVTVTRTLAIGNTIPPGHEKDRGFEPHQRGMYFGHGDIDGYSFWIEEAFSKYYTHGVQPKFGRMVFRKMNEMKSGPSAATIRATFDLEGPDRKPFAQETQTYRFSGDKDSRVIDCEFVIHAGSNPVKFGDTKEGAFAVRLTPELDSPGGTMTNSAGGEGEAQVWGKRADWVDVSGLVQGKELGVAVFDNPDSFRHPTYWHSRGYGLLAANPFGLSFFYNDPKKDGSYTLPAGQSIRFHYRVLIHEGDAKQAKIQEKYAEYVAHP